MRFFLYFNSLCFISVISFTTYLHASVVGKAIIVRGVVKIQDPQTKNISDLSNGFEILEGSMIETADRSFCKIHFHDQSSMSLGPSSKMIITKFPKEKAGIINLISGQLRSEVTKKMNQDQTKLYIKTKSAALGVRGTDFTTTYNNENEQTSVVTYSGEVALAPLDYSETVQVNSYSSLEQSITSEKSVMVKEGQFSGANPNMQIAITPIKISVAQLETIKANTQMTEAPKAQSKTIYNSIIPPSAPASAVVSKVEIVSSVTPENSINSSAVMDNNSVAPGGFVDLNTGTYIPPPAGSVYDSNTQTFIPPPSQGGFNAETGSYIPPDGFKLDNTGTFITDTSSSQIENRPIPSSIIDNNSEKSHVIDNTVLPVSMDSQVVLDNLNQVVDNVNDQVSNQVDANRIINMLPQNSNINVIIRAKQ